MKKNYYSHMFGNYYSCLQHVDPDDCVGRGKSL